MIDGDIRLARVGFRLDAQFQIPNKGVTVIFGPSGCGKTSLLRTIAGLEAKVQGHLKVNNIPWLLNGVSLPTHKRRLGYVFQNPNLFPHLTVRENLLFGARRNNSVNDDLDRTISLLGLESFLSRNATKLSGGEQQRVAIGRALLSKPSLLLLDEPLSALDANSKSKLIPFIENVLQHLDIPALYVTHSADEVARLADNLLLMEGGRVVRFGALTDVLGQVDSPLAVLEDAFTVLKGVVCSEQLQGLTTIRSHGGILLHMPLGKREEGIETRIKIQAKDVSLCLEKAENTSILNILPAIVENISEVSEIGTRTVRLALGTEYLHARVSAYSCEQLRLVPGLKLFAQVKSAALIY